MEGGEAKFEVPPLLITRCSSLSPLTASLINRGLRLRENDATSMRRLHQTQLKRGRRTRDRKDSRACWSGNTARRQRRTIPHVGRRRVLCSATAHATAAKLIDYLPAKPETAVNSFAAMAQPGCVPRRTRWKMASLSLPLSQALLRNASP